MQMDSGLQEMLNIIYSPNPVEKHLTGYIYSRAARTHSLTHLALSKIIFGRIKLTEDKRVTVNEYFNGYFEEPTIIEIVNQDPNIYCAI